MDDGDSDSDVIIDDEENMATTNKRKRGNKQDKHLDKRPKVVRDRPPQRSTVVRQESKKKADDALKKQEKQKKEQEKAVRKVKRDANKKIKLEKQQKKEREIFELAKQAKSLSQFVIKLEKSPNQVFQVEDNKPVQKISRPPSAHSDSSDDEEDKNIDTDSDATDFEEDEDKGSLSNLVQVAGAGAEPELEILMEKYPDAPLFSPMPFYLKDNMTVAPILWRKALSRKERRELDSFVLKRGGGLECETSLATVVQELRRSKASEGVMAKSGNNKGAERLKIFKFRDHDLQKMPSFPKVWPRQKERVRAIRRCPWRQLTTESEPEPGEDIWDESADEGSDEEERNFKGYVMEEISSYKKSKKVAVAAEDDDDDFMDFPRTRSGLERSSKFKDTKEDIDDIIYDGDSEFEDGLSEEEDSDKEEEEDEKESDNDESEEEQEPEIEPEILMDVDADVDHTNAAENSDSEEEIIVDDDNSLCTTIGLDAAAENSSIEAIEEISLSSTIGDEENAYPENSFAGRMQGVIRDWKNLDVKIRSQLPQNLQNFFDIFLS